MTTNINTAPTTVTLPITLANETREIEFTSSRSNDTKAHASGFAARIGNGAKLHWAMMTAYLQADGTWKASTATQALNRQATIVAFQDQPNDLLRSQHAGSFIAKNEDAAEPVAPAVEIDERAREIAFRLAKIDDMLALLGRMEHMYSSDTKMADMATRHLAALAALITEGE